jgi:hypothetical protein
MFLTHQGERATPAVARNATSAALTEADGLRARSPGGRPRTGSPGPIGRDPRTGWQLLPEHGRPARAAEPFAVSREVLHRDETRTTAPFLLWAATAQTRASAARGDCVPAQEVLILIGGIHSAYSPTTRVQR